MYGCVTLAFPSEPKCKPGLTIGEQVNLAVDSIRAPSGRKLLASEVVENTYTPGKFSFRAIPAMLDSAPED
jgi:hypothetical protein